MIKQTLLACALALAGLNSCNKGIPEARLDTAGDSLLYAMGVAQSADAGTLSEFLARMNADSSAVDEFLEGIALGVDKGYDAMDKVKETEDKRERAYMAGIMQGVEYSTLLGRMDAQLLDSAGVASKHDNFMAGFADYVRHTVKIQSKGKPLDIATAAEMVQQIGMRLEEPRLLQRYGKVKQEGEAFLDTKRKEAGMVKLPSGVFYRVVTEGQGAKPKATDRVAVRYTGRLASGKVFDATVQHDGAQADTFAVNQVIPGWTETLQLMPVGSKWEIFIPYRQAYGTRQAGSIPPFSPLVFEVELLGIH